MSRNEKGFEGTSNLQETDREQPAGGKAVWGLQRKTSPELYQGHCLKTEEMIPYPALRDK